MPHTHEKHVLQEREKEMKKKIYAALAAVAAAACILSACFCLEAAVIKLCA